MISPLLPLTAILISSLSFVAALIIYKIIIAPYLAILYYQRQGAKAVFHKEIIPHRRNLKDMNQKEDYFYLYREAARKDPNIKFFVENYGPTVQLMLADPEMTKEFLRKYETFHKDNEVVGIMKELNAGSLGMTEDAVWKDKRKMVSGAFNFEFLKHSIPMIVNVTQEKFNEWIKVGSLEQKNLMNMFATITGEIVTRFVFGSRGGLKEIRGVPISIVIKNLIPELIEEGMTPPALIFGPKILRASWIPRYKKLQQKITEMRAACGEMIREAEHSPKKENTLLDVLFEHSKNSESDDRVNYEDLTGVFLGLFLAGTSTTSTVVSITLLYLFRHPEVYAKVKEEIDREFADPSKIDTESLNRMNYVNATLKEAMRHGGPTGGLFCRVAVKDDEICGIKVKKGTRVNFCHDVLCKSEKYFTNPEKFAPERWLGGNEYSDDQIKNEPFAFVPFSGGPRVCLGQNLAMIEGKILLSLFIQTFGFKFSENYILVRKQTSSFIPRDPLLADLTVKSK